MNWLAHLYLSKPTPEYQVGNILPDLCRPAELRNLPAAFAPGVACHRVIDVFTDSDPIVKRSVKRLDQNYRRYGGIIMDMFYDHFLATEWSAYSDVSLESFLGDAYRSFECHRCDIPPNAFDVLQRMSHEDWLGSYRDLNGVRDALDRIGARLRKPIKLGGSVTALEKHRSEFHDDFVKFFPKLTTHVAALRG